VDVGRKEVKSFCKTIRYLTQQEVADRFRVSPSTIKNWRDMGLLTYFQAPGSARVLYPVDAIEEFERRSTKPKKGVIRQSGIKREKPEISARPERVWRI
jgi:hypothetical protein